MRRLIEYSTHEVYKRSMSRYIWQCSDWPLFSFDSPSLLRELSKVAYAQGKVASLSEQLGIQDCKELEAQILADEIHYSHGIEGEVLEQFKIYSSLCRRLQVPKASMKSSGPHIEGVVQTLLDALEHSQLPLTQERLFSWHRTLFPQGKSGPFSLHAGRYRTEPIEVLASSYKNQEVLYEAPPFEQVPQKMEEFLVWVNTPSTLPNTVRSAIAHLWFLSIHPFEDGNGRMARTIADYVLNQQNTSNLVLFSLATQLKKHQKAYYDQLHEAQTSSLDCTGWILWYLTQLREALEIVIETIEKTLKVNRLFQNLALNDRQSAMLVRLTTDFYGALTTQKWARLSDCSHDTAMRDIKDLMKKGALKQSEKGGRSTNYELVLE